MRSIDIHAHLTPQCFQREVLNGRTFHGMTSDAGELFNPRNRWTPEVRLGKWTQMGIDVQVIPPPFLLYVRRGAGHNHSDCPRLQQ